MTNLETVLRKINEARRQLGLRFLTELPQGERNSNLHHPLAKALGAELYKEGPTWFLQSYHPNFVNLARLWRTSWGAEPGVFQVDLPLLLVEFVEEFDAGYIPHLIDVDAELFGKAGTHGWDA